MLKYLIALGVIAIIFYLLLYWRFRHYIPVVRRIFGLTRDIYRMTKGNASEAVLQARSKNREGEMLVRCASCGTWIPAGRAVRLRGATYCSTECLEGTTQQRTERRSAKG